jgi:hypothetical protein
MGNAIRLLTNHISVVVEVKKMFFSSLPPVQSGTERLALSLLYLFSFPRHDHK